VINKLKPKSDFSRNVLTLMTGTTIAQAIPIAISPILTRIYTPNDFGLFALYMSIASILSVAATGRYELAIMLPKKDKDAINIVLISILISFLLSFISLIIVFFFNASITKLLGNPQISSWLYFIPITILLTGVYQSFNYWNNRKKQYKNLATSRVVRSGSTAIVNLSMGFQAIGSSGLILGGIIGQLIGTFFLGRLLFKEKKNLFKQIKKLKIFILLKRYIRFPKFDILASILNASSHQITHILFNTLFNSTIAGYYYLTQRIISVPITFIASAISDVFRESASQDFNKLGNAKKIYISTFKKLFILSFFPSIFLYIFAIDLFIFIFGEEWKVAGEYARIMTPMLFLRFISSPLSFMLYIGEKQQLNLFGNFLFLILTILSFYLADTPVQIVEYLTYSYSFIYIMYLYFSAKIAKVFV
jgi:O-antigen/teichoic acid export membrane protein